MSIHSWLVNPGPADPTGNDEVFKSIYGVRFIWTAYFHNYPRHFMKICYLDIFNIPEITDNTESIFLISGFSFPSGNWAFLHLSSARSTMH